MSLAALPPPAAFVDLIAPRTSAPPGSLTELL